MSQDIAVPTLTMEQRAIVAIGLDESKANQELTELAEQSKDLVKVTNDDSYKQIHAARMVLKNRRIEIEKRAKTAREDATKFSKTVIEVEKRLIGLIEPEEKRLEKIQQDHDDAEELAREAKILAEQARVADLQERLEELRGNRMLSASHGSSLISEHIADLEALPADASFQEFQQQAEDAKAAGLARLRELLAAAQAHETEQIRIAAEREELARLRAEQTKREAAERARIAEEERVAREAREAEAARQAEILKQEREAFEAERRAEEARQAETLRAQEAETARLRAEQEAVAQAERERIAAENRRLADERAAFEREQAEVKRKADEAQRARAAAEEAERKRKEEIERLAKKSKYPGEEILVDALVERFDVTNLIACGWIIKAGKTLSLEKGKEEAA